MKNEFDSPGYEFTYSNRHISKSRRISLEDMVSLTSTKHNKDEYPMFVKCGTCGQYMDFQEGNTELMSGKWVCKTCGVGMKEETAYKQLDRENYAFLEEIGMENDWD